jgi:hypothetical protein
MEKPHVALWISSARARKGSIEMSGTTEHGTQSVFHYFFLLLGADVGRNWAQKNRSTHFADEGDETQPNS